MIHVVYDQPKYCVTIDGHAMSGEAGHDLVCAAVSALAYTLAHNVYLMEGEPKTILQEGYASLSVTGTTKRETARIVFDAICIGFKILADNFPENIRYDLVTG